MNHKIPKQLFPIALSCHLIDFDNKLLRVVSDNVVSNDDVDRLVLHAIEQGGLLTKYIVVTRGLDGRPLGLWTHNIARPDSTKSRRYFELDRKRANTILKLVNENA